MISEFFKKRTYTTLRFIIGAGVVITIPLSLSWLVLFLEAAAISEMAYSMTKNAETYKKIIRLDKENQKFAALLKIERQISFENAGDEAKPYLKLNITLNSISIVATVIHGMFLELLAEDIEDTSDPNVVVGTIFGSVAILVHGLTHVFSSREKRKIYDALEQEHAVLVKHLTDGHLATVSLEEIASADPPGLGM